MSTSYNNIQKYKGTTTVAAKSKDSIVLATDTRVSMGMFIAHKLGKKILQIDDHLAVTIAGGVADAQNIVDIMRYYCKMYKLENKRPIPIQSASRLISNIIFSHRYYPYMIQLLVCGFDNKGPHTFNVDLFGSLNEEDYFSTGSGSPVAYGILESGYNVGMNHSDVISLTAQAIYSAIQRNSGTGDNIDIAYVNKTGYHELSKQEKISLFSKISVKL